MFPKLIMLVLIRMDLSGQENVCFRCLIICYCSSVFCFVCFVCYTNKSILYSIESASPRRKPPPSPRRRSPIARRGGSPRRLPESPPRRRAESPARRRVESPYRRGDTPPRRRLASPPRGRSSSPPPRRRSPARYDAYYSYYLFYFLGLLLNFLLYFCFLIGPLLEGCVAVLFVDALPFLQGAGNCTLTVLCRIFILY